MLLSVICIFPSPEFKFTFIQQTPIFLNSTNCGFRSVPRNFHVRKLCFFFYLVFFHSHWIFPNFKLNSLLTIFFFQQTSKGNNQDKMSYLSGVMEKLKEVQSKVMVISPTNYYIIYPIYHKLYNITWFHFFIHQITPSKGETTRKEHYDTNSDKQFISDMNDTYTVSNFVVIWKMENKERHYFLFLFFCCWQ